MRANTQFAIAIHILTLVALAEGAPVTSAEMASSVNTNPAFLRRILGDLSRAGLVESQPGVSGGWRLRRTPEAISLRDIFRAVDERHLLAMHHHPNPNCQIGAVIQTTLETYFGEAESAFEQTLAGRTLAQVVETALATSAREAS
ncbi:MAG TPA: Rrf2 family transcriptional regulator [Ktedonobacterales bacterium]|jgi:Rrf2 family protein|nr:Rrf2 family transcriptional regulator [Ktedonobacterales bacterium]